MPGRRPAAPARLGPLRARARRALPQQRSSARAVARRRSRCRRCSGSRSGCRCGCGAGGRDLVHAPNCFLPLRRPCPGVVTIHDLAFEAYPGDFAPRTRREVPLHHAARRALGRARDLRRARSPRDDVCERYGVDPGKVRVVPNAPSLPVGDAPPPGGRPYLLGVGDLRAEEELGPAGRGVAGAARRWAAAPAGDRRGGRRGGGRAARAGGRRAARAARATSTTRSSTR